MKSLGCYSTKSIFINGMNSASEYTFPRLKSATLTLFHASSNDADTKLMPIKHSYR